VSAIFKTLLASAQELHNASSLDKKVEVKLTDILTSSIDAVKGLSNDTKLKFNVAQAKFDESATTAQSVKNVASSITSGKNVMLDSSDDLTIKGSNVTAADTIDLKSKTGNIAITESVDTTNTNTKEKHASADVNLVVQNDYVETAVAVDAALQSAKQLKQTKDDYSNYKRQLKGLEASLDTLKKDPQVSERKKGTGYFLSRRMANRNCHSNKGFLKHLEIVEDHKRMKMYKKVACPLFPHSNRRKKV